MSSCVARCDSFSVPTCACLSLSLACFSLVHFKHSKSCQLRATLSSNRSFDCCLNLTVAKRAFDPKMAVSVPVVVDALTDLHTAQPTDVCFANSTPEAKIAIQLRITARQQMYLVISDTAHLQSYCIVNSGETAETARRQQETAGNSGKQREIAWTIVQQIKLAKYVTGEYIIANLSGCCHRFADCGKQACSASTAT